MASKAYLAVQAAVAKKQADLDLMDDQLLGMGESLPSLDAPAPDFDLLSQKRDELDENIRKMHERIELINAWELLKNGDWSEEVKGLLKDLDVDIASIADNASGTDVSPLAAPVPPAAPAAGLPPAAPVPPAAPAAAPVEEPAPVEEAPAEEPLPAPVASAKSASKETNYEVQVKKGNSSPLTLRKGVTMANQEAKPSLKKELVATKTTRSIHTAAQTRAAAVWTLAKTMLPDAPIKVQSHFASVLLGANTKVLKAALRQTAINSYNTKLAEDFAKVHKTELNEFLENPSVLSKEESAVASELKGDAKNASGKTADDRKDAGPQTETYNDGRGCGGGTHSEPKVLDAGDAGERPANTINKSEESDKTLKAAGKVAHGKDCKGCPECKKEGAAKVADEPIAPPAEGAPAPGSEAPAGEVPADVPPAGDVPPAPEVGEPGAEAEGATVLTEEKKLNVEEKIDEAEQAIQGILKEIDGEENAVEEGILEAPETSEEVITEEETPAGNDELNIEDIFNQDEMEDKQSALANEGDGMEVQADDMNFFGPSASQDMESSLEGQTASIQDYFSMEGSDADPLAFMFSAKSAGDVAGIDVLPSFTSETAKHFESDTAKGDDRDSATDHEDNIWAEALGSVKEEEQGSHRDKQDATNELELPKTSNRKKAYTGPIKATAPKKQASNGNLAESLLGDFFGDRE